MDDILIVKQSVWSEPIDESLPWQTFDSADTSTYPIEGAQVWVRFANGRSGPADFHRDQPGQFACSSVPWGALVNQEATGWVYRQWDTNRPQADGAE